MLNPVIKKRSFWAYLCTITGVSGYYGYYLKNREHVYLWIIIFAVGIILLGMKDYEIYKKLQSKLVFADILYLFAIVLLPSILRWPAGLDILLMTLAGGTYGYAITRYFYK